METKYEQLELCLNKITDDQFKSMFNSMRERIPSLMKLPDNVSRVDFLGAMQKWEKLSDVENYLLRKHPDHCPCNQHKSVKSNVCFNFINRVYERNIASTYGATQNILFDAPERYGKTKLLEEMKNQYSIEGWFSVYISINTEKISALELAHKIARCIAQSD